MKCAYQFLKSCARQCDLQDLIQCACEGLTKAVWKFNPRASKTYKIEDFDPAKGAFTGYANRLILGELRKFSRRDRVMFKPIHEDVAKALKEQLKEFRDKHERDPLEGELDLPEGVKVAKVIRAAVPNPQLVAMDSPSNTEDGTVDQWEMLACPQDNPEEAMIRREEEFGEMLLMSELTKDEHLAIAGYVLEERSYSEVGKRIGKPMTQVKELVKSGLEKMRKAHAR